MEFDSFKRQGGRRGFILLEKEGKQPRRIVNLDAIAAITIHENGQINVFLIGGNREEPDMTAVGAQADAIIDALLGQSVATDE